MFVPCIGIRLSILPNHSEKLYQLPEQNGPNESTLRIVNNPKSEMSLSLNQKEGISEKFEKSKAESFEKIRKFKKSKISKSKSQSNSSRGSVEIQRKDSSVSEQMPVQIEDPIEVEECLLNKNRLRGRTKREWLIAEDKQWDMIAEEVIIVNHKGKQVLLRQLFNQCMANKSQEKYLGLFKNCLVVIAFVFEKLQVTSLEINTPNEVERIPVCRYNKHEFLLIFESILGKIKSDFEGIPGC